jgi:hypothetical protein
MTLEAKNEQADMINNLAFSMIDGSDFSISFYMSRLYPSEFLNLSGFSTESALKNSRRQGISWKNVEKISVSRLMSIFLLRTTVDSQFSKVQLNLHFSSIQYIHSFNSDSERERASLTTRFGGEERIPIAYCMSYKQTHKQKDREWTRHHSWSGFSSIKSPV